MARKTQRERTTTKTNTTTNTSTTSPSEKAPGPGAALKRGFLALLSPSRVDRTQGGAGAQTARPKGMWRRLFFGMLIFIVAMQVFQYALLFIGAKFNLHLEQAMGKSIPLVGGMSRYTFLFLLFMIVLYIGLLRFNVIPNGKEMRAQRAAAQPQSPAGTSRAARRRAARHATTTTTATVSAARRTATVAKTKVKSAQATAAGISDDVYERVKAAQRLRRRREAKR